MLAVYLVVAFWALLGLTVFTIAIRGGLSGTAGTLRTTTRAARGVGRWLFATIVLGFGIAIPALILTGNHDNANGQVGGLKLSAAEKQGRELFGQHCAICHTLSAANAVGKVGPDLDTLTPTPTVGLVLHTIENGCLQAPAANETSENCLGDGTMPADVLEGRQATDVAEFVARVAGHE
jgi:mono/diheme cytochrome c family protein